ncbi:MAG TPA: hypothetical protein V6D25_17235 [Leptolyngbyaceae cyanobacterium]
MIIETNEPNQAINSQASKIEQFLEQVNNHSFPQDQKQRAKERLETMLLEGLNSGDATDMTTQDWEDIRQAVRERISKRQDTV